MLSQKNGHPACPFIPQKQLALYANPRFWQYGLLAFIARCCSFDNQHRDQGTGAAQAREGKSQTTKEKDVDALTFMRTVIMSFVRGMEYGEQTLPTNDLFVYLPVQILPDLVTAMEQQGFKPAEVKGGSGYRPKEEGAEDNPLIVVEVHTKDSVYDRYPRMPNNPEPPATSRLSRVFAPHGCKAAMPAPALIPDRYPRLHNDQGKDTSRLKFCPACVRSSQH